MEYFFNEINQSIAILDENFIFKFCNDKLLQELDINIDDISTNRQSDRQISITVTDSKLINYTGGIIQGMSGAPIIQDNKLIGAITHVIKNNSKKGYGIFIDEMIELDSKR